MALLIAPVTVWTGESIIDQGGIVVRDGIVADVLPSAETASLDRLDRVDGRGRLAIPGLINAHTHLYSSLARGMSVSPFEPTSFTGILEQLWWKLDKALDPATVRISALVGAMEAARCGITTLIDHHASPHAIPGSLDAVRDAVCQRVGLRGAFCYELSDRDGPELCAAGIEENLRFIESVRVSDGQCAAQFGLHASFTLGQATLEQVAATIPDGAGIHIHVAEGPEDEVHCETQHGMRIVERLDRLGLVRSNSILAHCLHVSEAEKDLLADRDAIVVHNPRSNMNNAVGSFDMAGCLDRGVVTGLGTDGLGANLLAELFTAGIAQKHSRSDPLAGPFDALHRMLFLDNPQIATRLLETEVGRLVPGAAADIALLEYVPPTPLESNNVLGHLLFGIGVHSLRVADLFVAGRQILADGVFTEIDEAEVYADARRHARQLWDRIG